VRISVGIEHIEDIKADFEQAFAKVFAPELVA
jgi:O-acetylhomoserine (thiol)-lyase